MMVQGSRFKVQGDNLQPRRGQVMLEFAISFIGIVMFVSVVLNVWKWLNTTIVERQAAFQRTRVLAGKATIEDRADTAGLAVPYRRPPIRLLGAAGSTASTPGGFTPRGLDTSCVPGNVETRAAQALNAQAEPLMTTYNEHIAQVVELNEQLETLGQQLDVLTAQINDPNTAPILLPGLIEQRDALQAEIDRVTPERDRLLAQANATLQQATDLYQQAHDLLEQGVRACP